jgi:ribosome-interacting GTPase 1
MPANLTPVYMEAERQFKEATTTAEKIAALQHMMAVIPKHKGTEHMRAELRQRLSKLKAEQHQAAKGASAREAMYHVEASGAGQAVLIGGPNAGKSSLVGMLTHAHPAVADYPFTTQLPLPGMMPYGGVQIQLVDTPPITPEYFEGWQGDLVRRADLALLVADLADDGLLEQVEAVLERLQAAKVILCREAPAASPPGVAHVATLLLANKCDAEGAEERAEILREFYGDRFPLLQVSARSGAGLEALKETLFRRLEILRVYAKPPGKEADLESPFVLKQGSTVIDFAANVHKDFLTGLKSARVWGSPLSTGPAGSAKYPGQAVERDHVLADGDVVELHR